MRGPVIKSLPNMETIMIKTTLTLVRLGSARRLTQLEPNGPYAELGIMRSRTPV